MTCNNISINSSESNMTLCNLEIMTTLFGYTYKPFAYQKQYKYIRKPLRKTNHY